MKTCVGLNYFIKYFIFVLLVETLQKMISFYISNLLPAGFIDDWKSLSKDEPNIIIIPCKSASFQMYNSEESSSPICDGCLKLFLSKEERQNHLFEVNKKN
jgi:hypothetical protein